VPNRLKKFRRTMRRLAARFGFFFLGLRLCALSSILIPVVDRFWGDWKSFELRREDTSPVVSFERSDHEPPAVVRGGSVTLCALHCFAGIRPKQLSGDTEWILRVRKKHRLTVRNRICY
jgi:hypothetical protein